MLARTPTTAATSSSTTKHERKRVHHRTMSEYGSYNFVDKDPVLDVIRAMIQLEADTRAVSFWRVCLDISERSGVHVTTLGMWFFGATVSPRFAFLERVINALGYSFQPEPARGHNSRRKQSRH